jgi:DNA invertase Pin-like site-specific DNA recombinase
MKQQRHAVAIYARISQDRDGTQLAVKRQLKDCRAEADRLGWTVAEEYVDDESAWSGKPRPAYERMLRDLADGRVDAILAWHIDRLYRRPIELEELLRVCQQVGVTDLRTVHGEFDLGTGDGMLVARLLAAVAANESDAKRRRGKRKALEIAEAGQPHRGGVRPFGFMPDRVTHNHLEADVIRQLADRALAGESLPSLGRWLDEHDVRTVTGKQWKTPTIRNILLSWRNVGIREHNGQPVGPANWEPIIPPKTGEALRRKLTAPERRTNRTARSYLLSGMCRCSKCGNKMFSMKRYDVRRYLCRSGLDFGGCGSLTITADPAEQIVAEAVLMRLDSPQLHDALAGRVRDDAQASALQDQIDADNAQLLELTDLWTERTLSTEEWKRAKATIQARLNQARKQLSHLSGTRDLDAYIGQGDNLRSNWDTLNLDRQRAIVKTVVDHVEILPGVPGARVVAVERINPVWRF